MKTRLKLDSNTIFVEDQSKIYQIKNKLKIMKRFSDKDYYDDIVRQNLVRKLELDDNYWQRLTREIFTKIKDYSFVIVKGLPFDDNDRFSIGISSIIGMPIEPYATADTHMVRKQTPGEVVYDQDVYPHTDGAHWPHPNDFTALQCVQADQSGEGHSRITPIDLVLEKIKEKGYSKMVGNLADTKYPFLLHKAFGNKGAHFQNILNRLNHKKDGPHVRFAARYIESSIKKFKINFDPKLFDEVLTFEKIITKLGVHLQFHLNEGEWLIFDNKRVLHSRSPAKRSSRRILKKIKINVDRRKIFNG